MAIITTPAAGVSPYQTTDTTPAVLRASADGSTVLANAAAATATVSELAATNANTLVVVTGQAALNSLISSNQPGVFDGANVTINLEEQNFNTTNQVTSTTNYPSGDTGEIQYNSGSNSFASSSYFTYTNGNVVTPGIRTDGYYYANGSPFSGGGSGNYSNSNVASFLAAFGSNVVSTTGNISSGNIVATEANISDLISYNVNTVNINARDSSGINFSANGYNNLVVLETNVSIQNVPLSVAGNIIGNSNVVVTPTVGTLILGDATATNSPGLSSTTSLTFTANRTGTARSMTLTNDGSLSVPGSIDAVGNITGGNLDATNLVINSIRSDDSTLVTIEDGLSVTSGIISAPGNLDISADGFTWVFEAGGNLTFPTGMHIDDEGANTRISQNSGFLKMTASNTATYQAGWAEQEGTGQGNVALVIANAPSDSLPGNLAIKTGNQSSPATTFFWIFGNDGDLSAPGDISIAGAVKTGVFVTGNIPSAAGVGAGSRAFVTDADSVTFGNLYTGGSGNAMPVWSNGTNWYIG